MVALVRASQPWCEYFTWCTGLGGLCTCPLYMCAETSQREQHGNNMRTILEHHAAALPVDGGGGAG